MKRLPIKGVDLTFLRRDDGTLDISGLDFIFFKDILKSFKDDEKFESRIAIETKEIENYSLLFSKEHIVSENGTYTKLNNFHRIDYVLENDINLIDNFISNDEIIYLLKQIQKINDAAIIAKIISALHTVHLVYSNLDLFKELKASLLVLKDRASKDQKWINIYTELLSSVKCLVDKNTFLKLDGINFLFSHYDKSNDRIMATIAELLNDLELFEVVVNRIAINYKKSHKNYRLEGEILRARTILKLGEKTLGELYRLLKNSKSQKSGIYYANKIFSYYMEENPTALLLFSNYYKCINLISKINIPESDLRTNNLIDCLCLIHEIVLNPSNTEKKYEYYLLVEDI